MDYVGGQEVNEEILRIEKPVTTICQDLKSSSPPE